MAECIPISRGSLLIIIHPGSEMCSFLMFWQSDGDYHNEINFANHSKWYHKNYC